MSSAKNSDQRRQDRAAVLQAHWAAEAKAARKQKVLWGLAVSPPSPWSVPW